MRLTDQQLAEIEARADAATPGPWAGGYARECVHHPAPCPDGCPDAPRRMAVARSERNADGLYTTICEVEHDDSADGPNGRVQARRDAEFIAAARAAVPALLEEVKALRAQRAALAGVLAAVETPAHNAAVLRSGVNVLDYTHGMESVAPAPAEDDEPHAPRWNGAAYICRQGHAHEWRDGVECNRINLTPAPAVEAR